MRPLSETRGFTLVEIAVVLAILALLVGSLVVPVSAQYEVRNANETQRQLLEIREALIGFALAKGYLPCPADAGSSGLEAGGRSAGQCNKHVGLLPWAALGTARIDSWGRQFRYSVTKAFTDNSASPASAFSVTSAGDIVIKGESGAALTSNGTVVAAVLSHGRNGLLGTTDAGVLLENTSATNVDEQENADAIGTIFHNRVPTADAAAPGGQIDDLVAWLPTYLLMNRLVAGRKLP